MGNKILLNIWPSNGVKNARKYVIKY
jgi:hypothetical protein